MLESEFLAALQNSQKFFTQFNRQTITLDFLNATYQGQVNQNKQPQGVGLMVDDDFNFIMCSHWEKGKLDGTVFFKLVNEVTVWGQWRNGATNGLIVVKVGHYIMYLPVFGESKRERVRRGLVLHEGKGKVYSVVFEKYAEGTKSKRNFSIAIQKVYSLQEYSIFQIAHNLDLTIQTHEQTMNTFLNFMQNVQDVIRMTKHQNGIFVSPNFSQKIKNNYGAFLGILLDRKKLHTKAVGMFSIKYNQQQNQEQQFKISINGLALSKTLQTENVIGIFKDNMLIRQFSHSVVDSATPLTYNPSLPSTIKQQLLHEHMKSLQYNHNFIYFPEVKKIVALASEMYKYVEMFQRLSHQKMQQQQSVNHHFNEKYENIATFKNNSEQSHNTIVDQFPQVKVDLKKQIYHLKQSPQKKQQQQQASPIVTKRPGFILNRNINNNSNNKTVTDNSIIGTIRSRSTSRSPIKQNKMWRK